MCLPPLRCDFRHARTLGNSGQRLLTIESTTGHLPLASSNGNSPDKIDKTGGMSQGVRVARILRVMKDRLANPNRSTATGRPPEISVDMVTGDEQHGLSLVSSGTNKALSALVVLGQVDWRSQIL